ncbi:MAG: hypothetical protein PHW00_02260 [Clostridia bacterium]|nr:hypothetical protein [Clostridia bacterium]
MRRFFNTIFISFGTFLLVFCWFYYYTQVVSLSAVVGMVTATLIALLTYIVFGRENRKSHNIENVKKIDRLKTYLALNECTGLVADIMDINGYIVTRYDCYLLAKKEEIVLLVMIDFNFAPLTDVKMAEYIKLMRHLKCSTLVVFCNQCDASAHVLARTTGIDYRIMDGQKVYELLIKYDICPPVDSARKYKRASAFLSLALSKSRFGYYLTSAIFIAIFSLFSFLPYYNLAIATILFALALYSKFNTRFNSASSAQDLFS